MLKRTLVLIALAVLFCGVGPLWAAVAGEGGRVIFPVTIVDAEGERFFETTLHLMNLSTTTSTVEVAVFSGGLPDPVIEDGSQTVPVKIIALEPQEALRVPFRRRPGSGAGSGARDSWAGVRVLEGAVDASLRLSDIDARNAAGRRVLSDILTGGGEAGLRLKAFAAWEGFRGCPADGQSAYAVVNPSRERTAMVRLRFFEHTEAGRDVVHETELVIPPLGKATGPLGDLFPDLFPPDASTQRCSEVRVRRAGLVHFTSDVPVAVEALHLNLATGHFYNLAVQSIDFADGEQAGQ